MHGLLDDQTYADGRGQVVDDVALVHDLADDCWGKDRIDDEVELGTTAQVGDVVERSSREVIQDENLPSVRQELLGEMGADEPGTSGDERLSSLIGHEGWQAY